MELADLGRFFNRPWRTLFIWVLRTVPNHAGFSMGGSFALWNRRCVVNRRFVSRVRAAAALPRENFRIDLHSHCCVLHRIFQLRSFLRSAAGSRFEWRAARWAKGTRLHTTGSKWKSGRPWRFAPRTVGTEGGCVDFLSRILVTSLQLRVAEFPATAFRIRSAWCSSRRHQRGSTG